MSNSQNNLSNQIQEDKYQNNPMKNFLGWRTTISDLKSLPKSFKIFLLVSIIIITIFNFVAVNPGSGEHTSYFLPLSKYYSIYYSGDSHASIFGDSHGAAIAVAVLYSLNGLAAFTGVLCVALINRNKSSQYLWQMINTLFLAMFALSVGYVGDFLWSTVLFITAPAGWYLFQVVGLGKRQRKNNPWKVKLFFIAIISLFALLVVMLWYWALPSASNSLFGRNIYTNPPQNVKGETLRVLDGMVSGLNMVGYAMQLANLNQQFYIWELINVVKILEFSGFAGSATLNVNMLILFAVWFCISATGLWNRNLKFYYNEIKEKRRLKSESKSL